MSDLLPRVITTAFGPAAAHRLDARRVKLVSDSGDELIVSVSYYRKLPQAAGEAIGCEPVPTYGRRKKT